MRSSSSPKASRAELEERLAQIQSEIELTEQTAEHMDSPLWEWFMRYLSIEKRNISDKRNAVGDDGRPLIDPTDVVLQSTSLGQIMEIDKLCRQFDNHRYYLKQLHSRYADISSELRRVIAKSKK